MCLPWSHKWKTIEQWDTETWDDYVSYKHPAKLERCIQQQCEHCGKEILRRYKV